MGAVTTLEQLARNFGEEIGRAYKEELFFCKATFKDGRDEKEMWEKRIEKEVPIVAENAYRKVLEIMNDPRQRKKYCLRKWLGLFRDKNILNINHENGFFDDLLLGKDLKNFFSVNVEYRIDMKNLSFAKIVFLYIC